VLPAVEQPLVGHEEVSQWFVAAEQVPAGQLAGALHARHESDVAAQV